MHTYDIAAKAAGTAAASANSTTVQKGSMGAEFMDILAKARNDLQSGMGLVSGNTNTNAIPERAESRPPADDRRSYDDNARRDDRDAGRADDRRDDGRQTARTDERDAPRDDRSADRHDDRDTARTDRQDDRGRDDSGDRRGDDGNDTARDARDEGGKQDTAGRRDDGRQDTAADQGRTGQQSDANTGETARQMTSEAKDDALETVVDRLAGDPTLAGMQAAQQTAGQNQQQQTANAANQTAATPQDEAAKVDAAKTRQNSFGQQWAQGQNGGDKSLADTHGQQVRSQAQQKAAMQADAQARADAQALAREAAAKSDDTAARQAAQLSRMVGDGNKVQVKTQVSDESKTLVSQPRGSLTSGTILSGDGNTQTQTQPGNHGPQTSQIPGLGQQASQQAMTAQAQARGGQAQTQQAAAQAAQQVLSGGGSGAEAKGPLHAATHGTMNAQPGQSLGGENATAQTGQTTTSQATTQSQQSSQAQNAQQPRFTLPGQSVADQISVDIKKALQNGNDRINIQLKPASLGRVEVQMELTHDGRVQAVVTADNKNTLDLLQKDAQELQKALQDAGLQADSGSLSFNLRGQQHDGGGDGKGGGSGLAGDDPLAGDGPDADLADAGSTAGFEGSISPDGRLDIRA